MSLDLAVRALLKDVVREVLREERGQDAARAEPAAPPAATELLTVEAVAGRCSVSRETVRNWIHSGALVARRAGRKLVVKPDDLERFLAARPVGDGVPPSISEQVASLMERRARRAGR